MASSKTDLPISSLNKSNCEYNSNVSESLKFNSIGGVETKSAFNGNWRYNLSVVPLGVAALTLKFLVAAVVDAADINEASDALEVERCCSSNWPLFSLFSRSMRSLSCKGNIFLYSTLNFLPPISLPFKWLTTRDVSSVDVKLAKAKPRNTPLSKW